MNASSLLSRPGRAALAALLAPLALALAGGCATTRTRTTAHETPARGLTAAESLQGDTGVVKTDFKSQVGPEQRVGVHLDLARALEAQGSFDAAAAEYQRALEEIDQLGRTLPGKTATAQKALAHRRMAAALDRSGRFAQAEPHYREALKLSPNDPKVWNDAGYSAYLQHRWEEAQQRLQTAARLAPDDPRIRTNLGLCLAAAGQTDKALEELSKVGGPGIAHANLAYILAALGKPADARRHYQIALQFEPELQAARNALARLDADDLRARQAQVAAGPADPGVTRTGSQRGTP